jgi:carbon monoxide dehydrogenase subunit G
MRVHAARDDVWRAVLDIRNYPRLIPGVVEARMVEDDGDDRVIFLRHRYSFVHAAYFAKIHVDEPSHILRFELDRSRPRDVGGGRGFLSVASYRGTDSIVTWGVLADAGGGLLSGVFAPLLQDWILRVPWCVRGRLEAGRPGC